MKYTCEIDIDKPIERVIELFDDPENMKEWQPGLVSYEFISGEPGQPGSKMKLKYKMGKREVEMVETLISRHHTSFSGTYEAKGVWNRIDAEFEKINEDQTRYITRQEFQLKGIMKLYGWLMPGAFKKQTMVYMRSFKDFAERS